MPFQWSCHTEKADGDIRHDEYLDTRAEAPMRKFTETLLDCLGDSGPIIVYSSFEKTRLKDMAQRFTDLAGTINAIIDRLVDLLPEMRAHYYHPDMLGSWSIKAVLPTLAPDLRYSDLGEVRDGMAAQYAYLELIGKGTTEERRKQLGRDMRRYREMDTKAMVKVLQRIECE